MKIEIVTMHHTHDCEICGTNFAQGGTVYVDGEVVLRYEPTAHCYDGFSLSEDELLVLALRKLGHTVKVDGYNYHINQVIEEDE